MEQIKDWVTNVGFHCLQFLARKAHINKCPSKYLEDIYERQINSHEAPGDYVIDPKALLAFLNKKNNFRMACHALTDIGSDGMVFYIAAIVKLVLQYSEYKSMQVIIFARQQIKDLSSLSCNLPFFLHNTHCMDETFAMHYCHSQVRSRFDVWGF